MVRGLTERARRRRIMAAREILRNHARGELIYREDIDVLGAEGMDLLAALTPPVVLRTSGSWSGKPCWEKL